MRTAKGSSIRAVPRIPFCRVLLIRIVLPIRVCLKISNQSPVDPDPFFDRDPDRDENPEIKVQLKNEKQGLVDLDNVQNVLLSDASGEVNIALACQPVP
jgi:hypothetical protein